MAQALLGKKIALLVAHGFEESEMVQPRKALEDAGAEVFLISPEKDIVHAWNYTNWSKDYKVDINLNDAQPDNFDGLLLPGGVINPDLLRINPKAVEFIQAIAQNNKPIASICHGPWVLINADLVNGKKLTSYLSIRKDLENAGAQWVDKEVVVDENLVTSRQPSDIPAFNEAMIALFSR